MQSVVLRLHLNEPPLIILSEYCHAVCEPGCEKAK